MGHVVVGQVTLSHHLSACSEMESAGNPINVPFGEMGLGYIGDKRASQEEERQLMTYFCAEPGVWSKGCGGECNEELCAADDRCNGFWWTKQSVRGNNRIVYRKAEI